MRMRKVTSIVLTFVLTCMMGMTAMAAKSPTISGYITEIQTAKDQDGNAVEATIAQVEDEDLVEDIRVTFGKWFEAAGVEVTEGMEVVDVKDISVPEGTKFPVTIDFKAAGVLPTTKVAVLHYTGDEWEVVESKAGKGIITATFTSLSPVAFVIDKTTMGSTGSSDSVAPQTGAGSFVPMMAAVAIIAGCGFVVLRKRTVK